MYIIDLFKRLFRKANIPVIIYLVLNLALICAMVYFLYCYPMQMAVWTCIPIALVIYLISLLIALSPIGEWILRFQTGCKKITNRNELDFMEPIFQEVYSKARAKDPSISPNVELFICDEECPNAFATGRKTVCITKGMLNGMTDTQIKGTLAHEFGHLSHKDTDLILLVTVGNLIVNAIIAGIKILLTIGHLFVVIISFFFGEDGVLFTALSSLNKFLVTLLISGLMWLWTQLGNMLVLKSSRSNEYEADAFACELGYGNELISTLNAISEGESAGAHGLFAMLMSSHPDTPSRISKIMSMQGVSPEAMPISGGRRIEQVRTEPVTTNATHPQVSMGVGRSNFSSTQPYYTGYQAPAAQASAAPLVLGIISLCLDFIGLAFFGLILSIIGICLVESSKKKNQPYSQGGFVTSIIGCVIGGIFVLIFLLAMIASRR